MITSSVPEPTKPSRHHALRHPTEGETTLYLVRHGRTASNVERIMSGRSDIPLDSVGLRQAEAIARRLAAETSPDVLISSPLSRALETARIIGASVGLTPVIRHDLVEIDFGQLDGMSFDRFLEDHGPLALRMLDDADLAVAWPGGESRAGFQARVRAAFGALLRDYARHQVIVVSHGGVIGAFLASILDVSPNAPEAWEIANCSLSHLDVQADGTVVHARNDVIHLEVLADAEADPEVLA